MASSQTSETCDEYLDEDDSEEEEEPKLKYERISGDLKDILKKDGASCIAVNSKVCPLINFFIHISCLKFSKSLKNFFSIFLFEVN